MNSLVVIHGVCSSPSRIMKLLRVADLLQSFLWRKTKYRRVSLVIIIVTLRHQPREEIIIRVIFLFMVITKPSCIGYADDQAKKYPIL